MSVDQTKRRFAFFSLKGNIGKADARNLPFENTYFDYVYSWGVLHHSPNFSKSIQEIYRVLKPGGKVGIMVYNRKSFLFRYLIQYLEGFLHFENNFLSFRELSSRYTDGSREEGNPYTFPVTKSELIQKVSQFNNIKVRIFGTDIDWMFSYLCFPYSAYLPLLIKKSFAMRFGWSIEVEAEKG